MDIAFEELKEDTIYEIHVGAKHYYHGTFKKRVDHLAYFDPLYAIFPEGKVSYAQGQYFNDHRIYKKIETPNRLNK